MIVSAVFGPYPRLHLIIGQLGEVLPFTLPRPDRMLRATVTG
jgi:hypothetical protein